MSKRRRIRPVRRMLSLLLVLCMVLVSVVAYAQTPDTNTGEMRITCQNEAVTGGSVYYKVNGEGEFTKVSEENNQYQSITLPEGTTSLTVKLSANEGYAVDNVRGVTLRVDGTSVFSATGAAIDDFMSGDGHIFNLSELLEESWNGSVAGKSFELEFGFGTQDNGDNPPPQQTSPVSIRLRNSQSGSTSYKVNDGNWNNGLGEGANFLPDIKDGDVIYVKTIPNQDQELDSTGTYFYTDGTSGEIDLKELQSEAGWSFVYKEGANYEVSIEYRGGGNDGGNTQQGDVEFRINHIENGDVSMKVGEAGTWEPLEAAEFILSKDQLAEKNITDGTVIYLKADKKQGSDYDLDTYEGQNRINDENIDLDKLRKGEVSFTYDSQKSWFVQIAFEGQNEQVTEEGKLDVDVTVNFWIYEQLFEDVTDDEGNPIQETDEQGNPVFDPATGDPVYQRRPVEENGKPVYGFVKADRRPDIEGIRLNSVEMFCENGSDTVKKGGYALDDSENKNVITFHDAYGAKTEEAYLVNVDENDNVTKINDSDFVLGENGDWSASLAPAESYDIAIVPGASDDLTIIWTTDYETADKWNDKEIGGDFAYDMYVEHGRVEVLIVQRGEDLIYDASWDSVPENSGINITENFGHLMLKRGDDIVLRLIPDYGYQLATIGGQDVDELGLVVEENEISTFSIYNIQNNIHFSSIFVEANNTIDVNASNEMVRDAQYSITGTPVKSGTLNMNVTEVGAGMEGALATVDIGLENVWTDRNGNIIDGWSQPVTELGDASAEVVLTVDGLNPKKEYAVIREHDGEQTDLPASVDTQNGTITFRTDRFSTYTIVESCPHPEDEVVLEDAKDPTCTEDGYTGDKVCQVCGTIVEKGEVIQADGHDTEVQHLKIATCTEDGYTGDEVCKVCNEVVKRGEVIHMLDHKTEVQRAKDATCTTDGYTGDAVCTVCKETLKKGEVIPATGHSHKSVIKPATCTTAGEKTYTCACGDTYTEVLAAIGHIYSNGTCTVCSAADPNYKPATNVTPVVKQETEKTASEVKNDIVDSVSSAIKEAKDTAAASGETLSTDKLVETVKQAMEESNDKTVAAVVDSVSDETLEKVIVAIEENKEISVTVVAQVVSEEEIMDTAKTDANKIIAFVGENGTVAQYLNLSVLIQAEDADGNVETLGTVDEPTQAFTFTLSIPEDLQKDGRTFYVVRVHNDGTAERINVKQNADGTISFTTDKFSTYALAYTDASAPKTGDFDFAAYMWVYIMIAICGAVLVGTSTVKRRYFR